MTIMRLGQPADMPAPPNTFPDFDWIRDNEADLLERYGAGFVIVYEKQVLGFGRTYQEAAEAAEGNLPPGDDVIYPVTDTIYNRHGFRYRLIKMPERFPHDEEHA